MKKIKIFQHLQMQSFFFSFISNSRIPKKYIKLLKSQEKFHELETL